MDENTSDRRGLGCIWGLIAGMAIVLLILGSGGPSSKNDTPGSSITNNRAGTASGNQVEVMSRNQLNLWSDVQNCYGDYSCMTVISTTTSTVQNTTTDTRNTTTVNGDRNVIYSSDGTKLCPDPDNPGSWGDVQAWCERIGQ